MFVHANTSHEQRLRDQNYYRLYDAAIARFRALNDAERECLWDSSQPWAGSNSSAARGTRAPAAAPSAPPPAGVKREIRRELIEWLTTDRQQVPQLTLGGVLIRNAIIREPLRLASATIAVAVRFINCTLEGRADFAGATLNAVRFEDCEVEGGVSFFRAVAKSIDVRGQSSEARSECLDIQLAGADVSEEVDLSGTRFNPHKATPLGGTWNAAATIGADSLNVGGRLVLDGATVNGEVRLADATISGSVSMEGTTLTAASGQRRVLFAHGCTIGGSLNMRYGFVSKGEIWLVASTIRRDIDCSGGRFCKGKGDWALNLRRVTILRALLGLVDDAGRRTRFVGMLRLWDADIRFGVRLLGVQIRNEGKIAVNARGIRVGRSFKIQTFDWTAENRPNLTSPPRHQPSDPSSRWHPRIKGSIILKNAKIRGEVNFGGLHISCPPPRSEAVNGYLIDASNLWCATDLSLCEGFDCKGCIELAGGRVGGYFRSTGASIGPPGPNWPPTSPPDAINAVMLTVEKDCELGVGFHARGTIDFDGATIGGQLNLSGGTFQATPKSTVAIQLTHATIRDSILATINWTALSTAAILRNSSNPPMPSLSTAHVAKSIGVPETILLRLQTHRNELIKHNCTLTGDHAPGCIDLFRFLAQGAIDARMLRVGANTDFAHAWVLQARHTDPAKSLIVESRHDQGPQDDPDNFGDPLVQLHGAVVKGSIFFNGYCRVRNNQLIDLLGEEPRLLSACFDGPISLEMAFAARIEINSRLLTAEQPEPDKAKERTTVIRGHATRRLHGIRLELPHLGAARFRLLGTRYRSISVLFGDETQNLSVVKWFEDLGQADYSPQPYFQLARSLDASGQEDEATEVRMLAADRNWRAEEPIRSTPRNRETLRGFSRKGPKRRWVYGLVLVGPLLTTICCLILWPEITVFGLGVYVVGLYLTFFFTSYYWFGKDPACRIDRVPFIYAYALWPSDLKEAARTVGRWPRWAFCVALVFTGLLCAMAIAAPRTVGPTLSTSPWLSVFLVLFAANVLFWPGVKWLGTRVLRGMLLGWGYKPWRPVGVLVALWIVGWIAFDTANRASLMTPPDGDILVSISDEAAELSPGKSASPQSTDTNSGSLADTPTPSEDSHTQWDSKLATIKERIPAPYPQMNPAVYSLDAMLPIINLGQHGSWVPYADANPSEAAALIVRVGLGPGGRGARALFSPNGFTAGELVRAYSWLHIALGWTLSIFLVIGVSGVVKGSSPDVGFEGE